MFLLALVWQPAILFVLATATGEQTEWPSNVSIYSRFSAAAGCLHI